MAHRNNVTPLRSSKLHDSRQRRMFFDALVAGSGLAGLMLALELANNGMSVGLVCKRRLPDSNSSWAQGGLAAVTGDNPADSPEQHLADTVACGAGLTNPAIAELIIKEGAGLVEHLERLGVSFDREYGRRELAREGGHGQFRVLHNKDASGRAITSALISAVRNQSRITILEDTFVLEVITSHGRACGFRALPSSGQNLELLAPHTVLATGGVGMVFDRTTNPQVATGDGIAAAYRAGASLVDMEFVQFHPTALYVPGAPASLITEAVRGAGAHLLDHRGERFAFRFHQSGELATRDIVSRAIHSTMAEQGKSFVYLDLRPIGAATILERFPNIVAACRNWSIDPLDSPIPIAPAAHYFMGGIWTDEWGRTSLPGLYAIGECASCGLHGANRLASNSLLEAGVMGKRAAQMITGSSGTRRIVSLDAVPPRSIVWPDQSSIEEMRLDASRLLGLVRRESEMQSIVDKWQDWAGCPLPEDVAGSESLNGALLATLIARGAIARRESRGAHFRSDYNQPADCYLRHYVQSTERSFWEPLTDAMVPAMTSYLNPAVLDRRTGSGL